MIQRVQSLQHCWKRPRRLAFSLLAVGVFLFSVSNVEAQDEPVKGAQSSPAAAQMSKLERVEEISKLTGRPIFAVAGQST